MAAGLAATLFGSGCLRLDWESVEESESALVLSEEGSVVLCPVATAISADGASYGVIWQEYPRHLDVLHLMFARIAASGEVLIAATPVLPLDAELGDLELVAVEEGFALGLAAADGGDAWTVHVDDDGELDRADLGDLDFSLEPGHLAGLTCGSEAVGPSEILSVYRAPGQGEPRVVFELR